MPNVRERLCPNCKEPADPDDEACSECGHRLLIQSLPPGKKQCKACFSLIKAKVKFCTKCSAPQVAKRRCCDEDLSDDDEYCGHCGKSWTDGRASGVKREPSTPYAVEAVRSTKHSFGPQMSASASLGQLGNERRAQKGTWEGAGLTARDSSFAEATLGGEKTKGTIFGRRIQGDLSPCSVLEKAFLNDWPNTNDAVKILRHFLQWPSTIDFVKSYEQKRVLSDYSLSKMEQGVFFLEEITSMMVSGKIQVEHLRMVFENEKNFLEICGLVFSFRSQFANMHTLVDASKLPAAEILKKIIKLRREEHDSFIKVRVQVNILLTVCKDIDPVDTSYLEKKESLAGDHLFLHQMCNPRCFGPGCENEPLVVVYFELPQVVFDVLKEVPKYQNFRVCSLYLKAAAKAFRNSENDKQRVLSVEEVARHVWNPCISYCLKICRNLKDGAITLRGVDHLLKTVSSKRLQEEIHGFCTLNNIGGDMSWIDSRFRQFVQYEEMKSVKNAAEVVMHTAHAFGLSGDFSFVEKLLESVQNPDQPLRNIEDRMVIAGKKLVHVDQEKLNCVRSFIKAREMVEWLRENLKGTQEVKVLVDLAMIRAAGQGVVEVNRVSCLHLAVTGFAPLIYNLKESAGFSELMDCLEEVWLVLQNDRSLPDRLVGALCFTSVYSVV